VSGTGNGGAVDSADNGGTGTLVVSGSTFSANSATGTKRDTGGGAAVDNGDNNGSGTLSVAGSSFSANRANYGGAIANGNGNGNVSVSTFSGNSAGYGGAIASGDSGIGGLGVSDSTFSQNSASSNGGAIDNGDGIFLKGTLSVAFRGTLVVSASTFAGNAATGANTAPGVTSLRNHGDGGAIDNGDNEGTGTLTALATTFSGNSATRSGGAIANFLTVWATADVFNDPCSESVGGIWNDGGYNVGRDATCLSAGTADVGHGAGLLGPLARDGGPTMTMTLLRGNPAARLIPYSTEVVLNGISETLCPTTDQRGIRSAAGQRCNAGAVQAPAVTARGKP
jgi:predicted outer membrane repeat protein